MVPESGFLRPCLALGMRESLTFELEAVRMVGGGAGYEDVCGQRRGYKDGCGLQAGPGREWTYRR